MAMNFLTAQKAVNKAYLKMPVSWDDAKQFWEAFYALKNGRKAGESEEHHKNLIAAFLKNVWYKDYEVNTYDRIDLVIRHKKDDRLTKESAPVGVIIEAKAPQNKGEMFSSANTKAKALREIILYFLREWTAGARQIKTLVITNYDAWYIFRASDFARVYESNKELQKAWHSYNSGQNTLLTTDAFYNEIAPDFITALEEQNTPVVRFTLIEIDEALQQARQGEHAGRFIAYYKILSPVTLLGESFANDSNSFDRGFYSELLHIMGLEEYTKDSKVLIRIKEADTGKGTGSLTRLALNELAASITDAEKQKEAALSLVITWINRLLFLKLLERQQLNYQNDDEKYRIFTSEKIRSWHDVNDLFFKVLAVRPEKRIPSLRDECRYVPYLNSSLFERTDEEKKYFDISSLQDRALLDVYPDTVLKDNSGNKRTGAISTRSYIFAFLNAFNFSSDGVMAVQQEEKTLINASVLGLIFEKINGYADGSFFTPGFVTQYMAEKAVDAAFIAAYNKRMVRVSAGSTPPTSAHSPTTDRECREIKDVRNALQRGSDADIEEAGEVLDNLHIADPACGSGHFLVSVLNRMVYLKWYLGALYDADGSLIGWRQYQFGIENDELIITDNEGTLFQYKPHNAESQRVQRAVFDEKRRIIENCLFGTDINNNSVEICKLRLWIELLKHSYYTDKECTRLETLPNIDINIKCGNSLLSRYRIQAGGAAGSLTRETSRLIAAYKKAVREYKEASDKDKKADIRQTLEGIYFTIGIVRRVMQPNFFTKGDVVERDPYAGGVEWMLCFPDVLDENGRFTGFDLVIGNPPYIKEYDNRSAFDGFRETSPYYMGKMDLWYGFASRGLDLLKDGGTLCFIATNNWTTNAGAKKLRQKVMADAKIEELTDFGAFMVFDAASIQTMVMRFTKDSKTDGYTFDYRRLNKAGAEEADAVALMHKTASDAAYLAPVITRERMKDAPLTFNSGDAEAILEKMEAMRRFEFTENEVSQGIIGGPDDAFKVDKTFKETCTDTEKPYIHRFFTSTIKYFTSNDYSDNDILYITSDKIKDICQYPNFHNHILPFAEKLHNRREVENGRKTWYELWWPRDERLFMEGEKIVFAARTADVNFAYTDKEFYCSRNNFIVKTDRYNLKFLCGLLNSKPFSFYMKNTLKHTGDLLQIDKNQFMKLPIPLASPDAVKRISELVDKILADKSAYPSADTSALEAEVDEAVEEMYGLTKEEIAAVHSRH